MNKLIENLWAYRVFKKNVPVFAWYCYILFCKSFLGTTFKLQITFITKLQFYKFVSHNSTDELRSSGTVYIKYKLLHITWFKYQKGKHTILSCIIGLLFYDGMYWKPLIFCLNYFYPCHTWYGAFLLNRANIF